MAYPVDDWIDFGVVIRGWWMLAAQRLLRGSAEEEFSFMDGPFELRVRRLNGEVEVTGTDPQVAWTLPAKSLIDELIRAAEAVGREFHQMGLDLDELRGLLREARALRTAQKAF